MRMPSAGRSAHLTVTCCAVRSRPSRARPSTRTSDPGVRVWQTLDLREDRPDALPSTTSAHRGPPPVILAIAIAIAAVAVAALMVVALRIRQARAAGRPAMPVRDTDQVDPSLVTLRSRPPGSRDVYAPAFIVEPGQCFRLCRDPVTGGAHPCDQHVEGRGEFVDHRGNVVEVEACRAHRVDLVNWQFRATEG